MMQPQRAWGRLDAPFHEVAPLLSRSAALPAFSEARSGLAYGNGRSYGDSCLNPEQGLWPTRGLSRLLAFDPAQGLLRCEAGILLRDIQRAMLPRGWLLPVTPGTELVTLGGAIANDVHGKNHHRHGSFGDHVRALVLLRTDGQRLLCSETDNSDWLRATIGGLGLTGVISEASVQLRPVSGAWLQAQTQSFSGVEAFLQHSQASEAEWEYTVAWVDCVSAREVRGLFMRARHCSDARPMPADRPLRRFPVQPPLSLVNRVSLRAFNQLYWHWHRRKTQLQYVPFHQYQYPLDAIADWNRMYGPRGFYQYQCVVPADEGKAVLQALFQTIAASGDGSFLTVLKTFGQRQGRGMLSFARPGITLAMDFPNRAGRSRTLFARLDDIVREAGGALYPAKDARMSAGMFEQGFAQAQAFCAFRDPHISSGFARRVMGY